MLSLPTTMAPAASSRVTTSASSSGTRSANTALEAVVSTPAVSMLSLSAIGMPCSGPRHCPPASSAPSAAARSRARSPVTVTKALRRASMRPMRSR